MPHLEEQAEASKATVACRKDKLNKFETLGIVDGAERRRRHREAWA